MFNLPQKSEFGPGSDIRSGLTRSSYKELSLAVVVASTVSYQPITTQFAIVLAQKNNKTAYQWQKKTNTVSVTDVMTQKQDLTV